MSSPRIKGTALSIRLGESDDYGQPVDYWADAVAVVMDKDTEYQPVMGGGYDYHNEWFFDLTAVQSTAEGSLWTFLWEHSGQYLPFAYAPHGNEGPTKDEPHFTGVLQVPPPPSLGGEAGQFVEYTFQTRMNIIQGPLRVTE